MAFSLTAIYDRGKKKEEAKETQIRILGAVRSELEMNLEILKEMDKKELYAGLITVFLVDSYRSSVSSGDFSMLNPKLQNLLTFTYLQFQQFDVLGDRLSAAFAIPTGQDAIPKVAAIIVKTMTEHAKTTLSIVSEALKKVDEELASKPNATSAETPPASPTPPSESDTLKAVRLVDGNFSKSGTIVSILLFLTLSPLIVAGFGFLWFARFFADLAAQAAGAGLTDTGVNILALSVAASAIGVSVLFLLLTLDMDARRRRIVHKYLFWKSKEGGIDPVTLHALIVMRAALPKDIPLEQVYSRNKSIFSADQLVLRLLSDKKA